MDKVELYRNWAPAQGIWSTWVKPVLFARLPVENGTSTVELPTFPWLSSQPGRFAVVFDLSSDEAVRAGASLARTANFRPVPLFTSSPPDSEAVPAAVPTRAALAEIQRFAAELAELNLSASAAPAFLLDANRWGPNYLESPLGSFDNRSAVFATDFPSAEFLRGRDIGKCIVVRDPTIPVGKDLGFALLPWRKAGIEFEFVTQDGKSIGFTWPPAGFLASLFHRTALLLKLRRNPVGGFGRFVPESTGG